MLLTLCLVLQSDEEAREGWTAAHEAADHSDLGGRISHLQVLTGSTLPILPCLEQLVQKFGPHLTRRDSSVSAVRVQLDGRRLVGVRFPRCLMDELKLALMEWQQLRGTNGAKLKLENAAPVDAQALAKATRPPTTIHSFFSKAAKTSATDCTMTPPEATRQVQTTMPSLRPSKLLHHSATVQHSNSSTGMGSNSSDGAADHKCSSLALVINLTDEDDASMTLQSPARRSAVLSTHSCSPPNNGSLLQAMEETNAANEPAVGLENGRIPTSNANGHNKRKSVFELLQGAAKRQY